MYTMMQTFVDYHHNDNQYFHIGDFHGVIYCHGCSGESCVRFLQVLAVCCATEQFLPIACRRWCPAPSLPSSRPFVPCFLQNCPTNKSCLRDQGQSVISSSSILKKKYRKQFEWAWNRYEKAFSMARYICSGPSVCITSPWAHWLVAAPSPHIFCVCINLVSPKVNMIIIKDRIRFRNIFYYIQYSKYILCFSFIMREKSIYSIIILSLSAVALSCCLLHVARGTFLPNGEVNLITLHAVVEYVWAARFLTVYSVYESTNQTAIGTVWLI